MNTAPEQILLFYKYVEIENPQEFAAWQRTLCTELELRGRIIVATEGINGTVGGSLDAVNGYKKAMREHPLFSDMPFKESIGTRQDFPRLRVMVKKEIVRLDVDTSLIKAQNGGIHLTPEETHHLLSNKPENLVILDCRNNYESNVGRMIDAITPNTTYFREFPQYIDEHVEELKNKEVLMYCTGGIRCERASAYMKHKGINTVYQIAGGIHEYIQAYPNGFFRGDMYVFDDRKVITVTDDAVSQCTACNISCKQVTNCINTICNKQYVTCDPCIELHAHACSEECEKVVRSGAAALRVHWRSRPRNNASQ